MKESTGIDLSAILAGFAGGKAVQPAEKPSEEPETGRPTVEV